MDKYIGSIPFVPGHRLYEYVAQICISLDASALAITHVFGKTVPGYDSRGNSFGIICRNFPLKIRFPVQGPLWAVLNAKHVELYELTGEKSVPGKNISSPPARANFAFLDESTFNAVYTMPFVNAFVLFYEKYFEELGNVFPKTKGDKPDIGKWTPLFRFAWAMRNAAVHKGGRVDFASPNVIPVEWYDMKYGWANKGRLALGGDIPAPDIFVLMLEMSDEMDRLGVPVL